MLPTIILRNIIDDTYYHAECAYFSGCQVYEEVATNRYETCKCCGRV